MKDKTKSILVAISFIVAMLLFIWGFNFLKGKSILNNQLEFYAVYDNSKGLLPGDLVTINGMQVGTVGSLRFHPSHDGSIIVNFMLTNELNIPANTIANLASSLTGSVSIDLKLGDSKNLAQNGDTLTSGYDNGTMGMITETLTPITNNIETLLISLNELSSNLNEILDTELKTNIDKGVSSLASSMENIEVITSDIQQLVDSNEGKLTVAVNNMETLTGNIATMSDSLKKIDYNHLVATLETCIDEFNVLIEGINQGKGSAGKLVTDDSLYYKVNETVATLQSLIDEIKTNPKKIKLSVF